MQIKKPIQMHLPKALVDMLELSLEQQPPKFSYQIEYFYYVVRYLTVREIQRKDDGYYFINLQNLASSTTCGIAKYTNYMLKCGIIEKGSSGNCYGYRINPKLTHGVIRVEIPVNTRLFDKLIEKQRGASPNKNAIRLESHMRQLLNLSLSFDLDYAAARKWINENADGNKLYYYHTMLDMLEDKRSRFFKRSRSNGRLNSNLSTLKKELKQFIIGDWVQIDLKNSQPFFLAMLLRNLKEQKEVTITEIKNNIVYIGILYRKNLYKEFGVNRLKGIQNILTSENEEILKLKKSCVSGTFYEDFLEAYGDEKMTRDDAKKILLPMLFSNNYALVKKGKRKGLITTPYSKEKKKFRKVYPTIAKMLHELKHKDNSILPIYMQYMESYLFIDCVAYELVNLGIIPLTIHDSIIVPVKDKEEALKMIKHVFSEVFGVVPSFHVDKLKIN